ASQVVPGATPCGVTSVLLTCASCALANDASSAAAMTLVIPMTFLVMTRPRTYIGKSSKDDQTLFPMADRHTGKGLDSRRRLTMVRNDECRRRSRSYVIHDGIQAI